MMIVELDAGIEKSGVIVYRLVSFNLNSIKIISERDDKRADIFIIGEKQPYVTLLSYTRITSKLFSMRKLESIRQI